MAASSCHPIPSLHSSTQLPGRQGRSGKAPAARRGSRQKAREHPRMQRGDFQGRHFKSTRVLLGLNFMSVLTEPPRPQSHTWLKEMGATEPAMHPRMVTSHGSQTELGTGYRGARRTPTRYQQALPDQAPTPRAPRGGKGLLCYWSRPGAGLGFRGRVWPPTAAWHMMRVFSLLASEHDFSPCLTALQRQARRRQPARPVLDT